MLTLAADADIALDLHCDSEALMHLYTATPVWDRVEPLARYLGAVASLLETTSGDPFDEACLRTWWQLRERFPSHPIPMGCASVTIELRGNVDVDHALAAKDADAIVAYLRTRGSDRHRCARATGFDCACDTSGWVRADHRSAPGVVTFLPSWGSACAQGDPVADVIDP